MAQDDSRIAEARAAAQRAIATAHDENNENALVIANGALNTVQRAEARVAQADARNRSTEQRTEQQARAQGFNTANVLIHTTAPEESISIPTAGSRDFVHIDSVEGVSVATGPANDYVSFSNLDGGNINTGTGDDVLTLRNTNFGGIVRTGPGDDVVRMQPDSSLSMREHPLETGPGNDRLELTSLGNDTVIDAGPGDDRVALPLSSAGRIRLGDGNDTLTLTGSETGGIIDVNGGNGINTVVLPASVRLSDITVGQWTPFNWGDASANVYKPSLEIGDGHINLNNIDRISIQGVMYETRENGHDDQNVSLPHILVPLGTGRSGGGRGE